MKFNLKNFIQLDVSGLLTVNGGATCSTTGNSSWGGYGNGGGSCSASSSSSGGGHCSCFTGKGGGGCSCSQDGNNTSKGNDGSGGNPDTPASGGNAGGKYPKGTTMISVVSGGFVTTTYYSPNGRQIGKETVPAGGNGTPGVIGQPSNPDSTSSGNNPTGSTGNSGTSSGNGTSIGTGKGGKTTGANGTSISGTNSGSTPTSSGVESEAKIPQNSFPTSCPGYQGIERPVTIEKTEGKFGQITDGSYADKLTMQYFLTNPLPFKIQPFFKQFDESMNGTDNCFSHEGCKMTAAAKIASEITGKPVDILFDINNVWDENEDGLLTKEEIAAGLNNILDETYGDIADVETLSRSVFSINTLNEIANKGNSTYVLAKVNLGDVTGNGKDIEHWIVLEGYSKRPDGTITFSYDGTSDNDNGRTYILGGSPDPAARIGSVIELQTFSINRK